MNGSKRKRAQDDEEDYSPQRKQAFTDEVLKERQAEKALRSMSIESRAHCAKFPFWAVATWQERYIIANEEPMHDINKIEERWPGLRARQAAHDEDKFLDEVTRDIQSGSKLRMDDDQENVNHGGSNESWKAKPKLTYEQQQAAAEAAERARGIAEVPLLGVWHWLEVQQKIRRLLVLGGFCAVEAASSAVGLLKECKDAGRATLKLRTMLRHRSPLHNPFRFLVTILAPLRHRLNQVAGRIFDEWGRQAEEMTTRNLEAVAAAEREKVERAEESFMAAGGKAATMAACAEGVVEDA